MKVITDFASPALPLEVREDRFRLPWRVAAGILARGHANPDATRCRWNPFASLANLDAAPRGRPEILGLHPHLHVLRLACEDPQVFGQRLLARGHQGGKHN